MKAFKTILGALAVAGLLGFSFNASAQENGNRDENGKIVRGAYQTNKASDNWFIGIGGGLNSYLDKTNGFGKFGPAAEIYVGKWFTPSVGARFGYKGFKNQKIGDIPYSYEKNENKWQYNNAHADLLWNVSNAFSGYKETRFWDFIPYASFATLVHRYESQDFGGDIVNNWEYGAGFGLINDLRLGNHIDLFIDCAMLAVRAEALGKNTDGWFSRVAFNPSLTAGLIFNLNRTGFDRHSSVTPVVVPVPFTTDQYNALKLKVADLEKEKANLMSEIEKLRNTPADTVYVGTEILSPAIVYFNLDKATLTERELAHLDFYVNNVISKNSDHVFTLTGSADKNTGNHEYNQKLSERRVNYVHDILVKKYGIGEEFIVKAEGDTNNKFEPYVLNRCVTIE